MLVAQSCSTLCDLMDCTLPGSSVRGILQERILEWVAIPFSRGSDLPDPGIEHRSPASQADSLQSEPPRSEVSISHIHVQLFATPMDYSPPGSSVYGILQARILE